jgi:hypothetical protein
MATSHHNGKRGGFVRPKHSTNPARRSVGASATPTSTLQAPTQPDWQRLVAQLRSVHSACITIECALQAQNADHDAEFCNCLHVSVTSPIRGMVESLRRFAPPDQDRGLEGGAR